MEATRRAGLLAVIGPGLLVAATGVGAGDLATAAFTGNQLGTAVLWAVLVGAFIKFVLNEGLARWQLATGQTVLEGAVLRLGRPVQFVFGAYFLLWSYFVGSALISACGVAGHAMFPVFQDAVRDKVVFGIAHSLLGLLGGFRQVQKAYAVFGALFMPLLAAALLVLNGRAAWVGLKMRNRPLTTILLAATVLFFLVAFAFLVSKTYGL